VYTARKIAPGFPEVALKVMRKSEPADVSTEAEILKKLSHPNIIKFEDSLETETHVIVAMELARGGELFHYVRRQSYCHFFLQFFSAKIFLKS
jgi:serine/threonine protein kinase